MVVRAIPFVESAPISGQTPLVRNDEVTPPGYENIVKGLKKSGKVDNPWAVAWSMKSKGIKPKTAEAAPVASGMCHDEEAEACQCPDCKKIESGIPSELVHDETGKVPVKAFRDDIQRKLKLRKVMGKHNDKDDHKPHESSFPNPPGPIPTPFKKNTGPDEVVNDYSPTKRYSKTSEAIPSSFNDDPAGMDDTSDLDLGMLDPDNNEEIPTGDDQMWTKEEVNYRYSGDKFESCGNCVHFKFPGSCDIIAGPVRPVDVCDKFEAEDEDQGAPFGWQGQQNEDEDAHSVYDQTVPSTLVPLKDKNVVQAEVLEGGPASAWGMVASEEGGPGSGRHPEGGDIAVHGTQEHPSKGPHTVFTDKVTGSTMMLPADKATSGNMHAKAIAKRREFFGDPTKARQGMKDTARNMNSEESAAIRALTNRLIETAFDTLKNKLAHKKGIYSPGGLAAKIGRDKMGKAAFQKKAAAGRKKAKTSMSEAPGEFMKVGPQKDAGDASGKMAYEPTQRNKTFKGFRDSGKKVAPEA